MTTRLNIIMSESAANKIGQISLKKKLTGKRSAGKPHAAFDEAGAGNVVIKRCVHIWQRSQHGAIL
jgi:hypothetical protein